MGFEPVLFGGRPCDLPDCAASAYPSLSLCPNLPVLADRDLAEIEMHVQAGRVASTPEALKVLAESFSLPRSTNNDRVEVTGSAWEIVRMS
jgi:hypothetical protein